MTYLIERRDSESGDLVDSYQSEDSLETIKENEAAKYQEPVSSWESCENEDQPDLLWQLETYYSFIYIRKVED